MVLWDNKTLNADQTFMTNHVRFLMLNMEEFLLQKNLHGHEEIKRFNKWLPPHTAEMIHAL